MKRHLAFTSELFPPGSACVLDPSPLKTIVSSDPLAEAAEKAQTAIDATAQRSIRAATGRV
jgi:hypothetical protein